MVGIPVGYEASVSRAAKITVPYRCSACAHQDTALVVGMGSGTGGGRGYGRDAAAGIASAAAGQVIEQDAKRIAAAIRCPKCGAGGRTPATLKHPHLDAVERQTKFFVAVVMVVFAFPVLLMLISLQIVALVINLGLASVIVWWLRRRRDRALIGRRMFVDAALADAALWSVAPERFPKREQSVF